jgi:hypothetical protein
MRRGLLRGLKISYVVAVAGRGFVRLIVAEAFADESAPT